MKGQLYCRMGRQESEYEIIRQSLKGIGSSSFSVPERDALRKMVLPRWSVGAVGGVGFGLLGLGADTKYTSQDSQRLQSQFNYPIETSAIEKKIKCIAELIKTTGATSIEPRSTSFLRH